MDPLIGRPTDRPTDRPTANRPSIPLNAYVEPLATTMASNVPSSHQFQDGPEGESAAPESWTPVVVVVVVDVVNFDDVVEAEVVDVVAGAVVVVVLMLL